ncbi:hypothetical protein Tco_0488648 [Tanacetum coccineum]
MDPVEKLMSNSGRLRQGLIVILRRHHWMHNKDSSSTSGWVFLLGGGAISWASKKKACITGSTMKSEFVALAVYDKEA